MLQCCAGMPFTGRINILVAADSTWRECSGQAFCGESIVQESHNNPHDHEVYATENFVCRIANDSTSCPKASNRGDARTSTIHSAFSKNKLSAEWLVVFFGSI